MKCPGAQLLFRGAGRQPPLAVVHGAKVVRLCCNRPCLARFAANPVAMAGVVPVSYQGLAIAPASVRIKARTTLRWTNLDATLHNVVVTSGPAKFSSPAFNKGGTYKATFTKPGVYHYLCTYHPATMKGTITVVR